jgi:NADPH2:quinone reductase
MRAIGLTTFGGPDVLQVIDQPEPHAGAGQVRIRVHAATVNPADALVRDGGLADSFEGQEPPYIPGMDAAGVVDEIGPGGDGRLAVGDRVIAIALPSSPLKGAYAEQIVLPAASVVKAPRDLDFPAASTLLMNALTVRLALDSFALPAGATIGVTGAAGAVGGYAIQLARADGLRVVADAKTSDRDLVKSLGADLVVERGDDVAQRIREVVPEGVSAIIDTAMQHDLLFPAIADGGALSTLRGWKQPAPRGIRVLSIFVTHSVLDTARLDRLRQQAEDGTLSLRVAQVFPASRAADAHRLLEAGGLRGRLVLDLTRFE